MASPPASRRIMEILRLQIVIRKSKIMGANGQRVKERNKGEWNYVTSSGEKSERVP